MTNCHSERARALVGCRFRPQGRDPELGLDCIGLIVAAFDIPVSKVPRDYRLRSGDRPRLLDRLKQFFRRVPMSAAAPGDVLFFSIAGAQLHLAVRTPSGFVHADARLRRIVETPGAAPWPLVGAFRKRRRGRP